MQPKIANASTGVADAEFPGDFTALDDFKNWYFNTPEVGMMAGKKGRKYEYIGAQDSEFDGGVRVASNANAAVGFRVGDGETEDRYADGETESTDGGAKLRWY